MIDVVANLGWTLLFILIGSSIGILIVFAACALLPKILNKLTPGVDEEKEIARGNVAMAQYFGRVSAAGIIGVSVVVAAAVVGGIVAGLF